MGIPVSHMFRHIPSLLPGATAKLADVAVAEAQFESMFTEEAEKSKLDRDISQLSSAKRSLKTQTLAYFFLSNLAFLMVSVKLQSNPSSPSFLVGVCTPVRSPNVSDEEELVKERSP
jgi:hypothetical protein